MATITLPRSIHTHQAPSMAPLATMLSLDHHMNTSAACPPPLSNKHTPVCPPGPASSEKPDTPPASPPKKNSELPNVYSLLYPPDQYPLLPESSAVYSIDAAGVASALNHQATQPIPDPSLVFPWLHGLHPENHLQQQFFTSRRRSLRRTPQCARAITIVKSGSDLSRCRLKGAITPEEFLQSNDAGEVNFGDVDPREGFNVRNFQIQAAKWAFLSDIIVYGDAERSAAEVRELGEQIAKAQKSWKEMQRKQDHFIPTYSTFVCTSEWKEFEDNHPELVVADARGMMTGRVMDFLHQERVEMCEMTKASEIAHNVWLGPTPDERVDSTRLHEVESIYDVFIECNDAGRIDPKVFQIISESSNSTPTYLEFPSSGSIMPPSWSDTEVDGIVETCKGLYALANGQRYSANSTNCTDSDGDSPMPEQFKNPSPRRILIHCTDGYTESTLLALSYFVFSTDLPLHAAWLQLHTEKKRNFFAYPSDVVLLQSLAPRLSAASPAIPPSPVSAPGTPTRTSGRTLPHHRRHYHHHRRHTSSPISQRASASSPSLTSNACFSAPQWLRTLDGSLPSRILPHLYLGNLNHANNPALLHALGIKQILSVGETYSWPEHAEEAWGEENICIVGGVQDNGIDPLANEFERCLEFIERGRLKKTATLVHCRVGVSRSATICIASVMRTLEISFPRAYCFVRARRLNVIIQPHLRFAYELMKWEEKEGRRRSQGKWKRELEWNELAREITALNRPYTR